LFFLTYASAYLLNSQPISTSMREIEELYKKGKYSLVLEKSLNILNTKENRLSPAEGSFLYYYIGLAYKENQNNEMAVEYLKKITVKYPASEYLKSAYLELANILKDDYFQKETYLAKVFEAFPKTPEAVQAGIELSKDYLRLKNYKKALPVMETIVNLWKKGDENPELYILMAVGYSGIKDYIEAGEYLRRAERAIPEAIENNPRYLFEAGKILHNNLNFKSAIKYLERLFNVYPRYKDLPEATVILANCYEREKKFFLSAVFLIKAIEKKPPQKYIHTLFLNLGRILGLLNDKELLKIKRNYPLYSDAQKLLTYVKNNSLDFEQRRTAAILLSDEYKKNDNMEKVVDNLYKFLGDKRDPLVEKMFKKNLDNFLYDLDKEEKYREIFKVWIKLKNRKSYLSAENLLRFGEIFMQMKMYANAEEIYQHLLKYRMYSKFWPTVLKQLARIQFRMGEYEECLESLKRLELEKDQEINEFTYYRFLCYRHLHKEEQAEKLLNSGTITFQEISDIFHYRLAQQKALLLEKEKKFDLAMEIYQKMLSFKDVPQAEEGKMMVSIANLYYQLKDLESSLSYYRLAEKYNSNMEWILYRIVIIFRELNKMAEAKEELEKLKKINPDSFWLKQLEKNV